MSSMTSSAVIQCLRGIFAQLGLPEQLVTDNEPNLVSTELENFLHRNGVRHTLSPPYHPASNGLAERAVQIFKQGLKKMSEGSLRDRIARFLFSYRTTPQSTTGTTPAELLMGRKLRSPLDLLKPDLYKRVEGRQESQKQAHDRHAQSRSLHIGEAVYSKNFGQGPTWLPGYIVEQTGPLSFKVDLTAGRKWRRQQDHLRKRYDSEAENHEDRAQTPTSSPPAPVPPAPQVEIGGPHSLPHAPVAPAESSIPSEPQCTNPSAPEGTRQKEQTPLPTTETFSSAEGVRRYPQRNRRPPDRYTSDHD